MAGKPRLTPVSLTVDERQYLVQISRARKEAVQRVRRALILLSLADGRTSTETATDLGLDRQMVMDTYHRFRELGAEAALEDRPRSGRPPSITEEAKLWLIGVACQKPLAFGYPHELWTLRLLAGHIAAFSVGAGHPCLDRANASTVWRVLNAHALKPHRVTYYLEKRDPLLTRNRSGFATYTVRPKRRDLNQRRVAMS